MLNDREKAMAKFYEQCQEKGYTDMQDAIQSLKAKVIATDLGLNYGNIVRFYERSKLCHQKVREDEQRAKQCAAREAVQGTLLVTMMNEATDPNKMRMLNVFIRPDGSIYSLLNDEKKKVEGVPSVHVKKGGYLSYTYSPSEMVYTGVTVGGVHTGGIHQTEECYYEKSHTSGKGYIEVSTEAEEFTVKRIIMAPHTREQFRRDKAYRDLVDYSGTINCYKNTDIGRRLVDTAIVGDGDIYHRMQLLSMAVDEERLDYGQCIKIANLLGRIINGEYPPDDAVLYANAEALSKADTAQEIGRAIKIFNDISDYRDAAKRAASLKIRYEQALQTEKEQAVIKWERDKKILIIIAAVVMIVLVIAGIRAINDNMKKEQELCLTLQSLIRATEWERMDGEVLDIQHNKRYKVVSAKAGNALLKVMDTDGNVEEEYMLTYKLNKNGGYTVTKIQIMRNGYLGSEVYRPSSKVY